MRLKRHDVVAVKVQDGDDAEAVALHAEAWSRTMRDDVRLLSDANGTVRLRGMRVQTQTASSVASDLQITIADAPPAGAALASAFNGIARRYGNATARLSAFAMESLWGGLRAPR